MSIDKIEVQEKAQKFLNLYSFYMSSYKQSFNNLIKVIDGFYGYINDVKKKIIDLDELISKRKETLMEDEDYKKEYEDALRGMYPSYDTPTINLLVSTLLRSTDLENDLIDRIENDPRFEELKKEDICKLLEHIKHATRIHRMDTAIKEYAQQEYRELVKTSEDYSVISSIEIITYLATLIIREQQKGNMYKKKTSTKNDRALILELLYESKHFSKHKIDDILQEIADKISTHDISPITYISKQRDRTLGSYMDELHTLNISSMLFYNSYLDSSYDNFPVIVEILETTEHESAHSNNHVLMGTLFYQVYKDNVPSEVIAKKLEEDPTLFIAAASLIESTYMRVVENKDVYTSEIDEQNSRNQEFRFLEDLYNAVNNKEIKHKIACIYDLAAAGERKNPKYAHLEDMIEAIRISLSNTNNEMILPLNRIIDAMEILLKRKVNDKDYEVYFMETYFPYLHSEECLSRHSVDDEDPVKKQIKEISNGYISNLYMEDDKKKKD